MRYSLLSILYFIYGVLSEDCAHIGALAINQCIVIPDDSGDVVSRMVTCDDDGYYINGFTDNQCTEELPDDDSQYSIDVSILCPEDVLPNQCTCTDYTEKDDCYVTVSDYKDCDNDGYTESDVYASLSATVDVCVLIGENDDEYDADLYKTKNNIMYRE